MVSKPSIYYIKMENYNKSSEVAQQMILQFIKSRMKDLNISQAELARLTDLQKSTIGRYLNGTVDMTLRNYLKICGALNLRPYLVPSEFDKNEMMRTFFN